MTALTRTVFVFSMALACWFLGAGSAVAHTALASSDPAKGAIEAGAPTSVTLTFSEQINPHFATVAVTSSDGRNWASGAAQVTGSQLRIAVGPDLPAGAAYTVGYRVVSADGHPVAGAFEFAVAPALDGAAPAPAVTTSAPATSTTSASAEPSPSAPLGTDSRTSILAAGIGGLLVGGAIVFWQSRRRRRGNGPERDPS